MSQTECASHLRSELPPVEILAESPEHRETVLVVEDEAFVREVTCETLESEGYRVLRARTAEEARTLFARYRKIVRLLLTDVVLPGQNGRELAEELRTAYPALRTIFTSGYPENAVTRLGIAQEDAFYLPKPFTADSLIRRVRAALATNVARRSI